MAIPAWLTVSPQSGSGNQALTNTATAHTGRTQRTATVEVTYASKTASYTVNQTAKPEFVSFDDGTEVAMPKQSESPLTIRGKSNSQALTFSLEEGGSLTLELPETYNAGAKSTTNGADIDGDPGATAEYAFDIAFTVPTNTTIEERTCVLTCTPKAGDLQKKSITIKQAAGDATLSIDPTSITIPAEGGSETVQITANCTWAVKME